MQDTTVHVLLVEDDDAHVDLMRRVFEHHGSTELTVAGTLEEARNHLATSPPDLIVADLLLPDGRGTELLQQESHGEHCPVVVMTSFGNEQAAVEAMKAGALDYVVKSAATLADMPHIAERALRQWQQVLQRKQAEAQLQQERARAQQRKEAEEAIRDSETKYRTLFQSTHDAVMLLDENEFFECNEATLRIFGCSTREEFVGKHPSELSPPMQPDGTDSLTAARAKITLAVKTGSANFEWMHRRIDGTQFMADVLLSSMELKGKKVLQAVVRDITQRKRAEQDLLLQRQTLRRLLESSDRDRQLTAYEIHDGLTQQIAGAKMQFEAFDQFKSGDPQAAARAFDQGLKLLSQAVAEARQLISGLRPPILDEAGVVAAIQHLVHDLDAQQGPKIDFSCDAELSRLEPLLENAIFRIVQESVTNARRYSQSDKLRIALTRHGDHVRIEVQDWGVGFDPDNVAETCFGLGGIRERARLLGGQATIDSTLGKGTLVAVELPLVENRPGKS